VDQTVKPRKAQRIPQEKMERYIEEKEYCTCLILKVFVVDDDALAHLLVAHLIAECR
jgi:hypothetical protein